MGEEKGKLEEFFETFESKGTITTYKWALREFFELVYGKGELGEQVEQYFKEKRNYEKDVKNFFSHIKHRAPLTVSTELSAVRTFLMEQKVELSQLFWRRLRGRKKGMKVMRARTQDYVPETTELRRILFHMGAKGKALYLTLASSGMRIGEALKSQLDDVDLNHEPPKVNIRGEYTKTGSRRTAFISREAKEALEEWLKIRKQYLITASKRSRYVKAVEDKRIFPYGSTTAHMMWTNACKKAGFDKRDKETNRFEVHPHVLRKFFRSKLAEVIPLDIVEALMGHEGYLTKVYRRHNEKDVAQYYIRGEKQLLIFAETAEEVRRLREEIDCLSLIKTDGEFSRLSL